MIDLYLVRHGETSYNLNKLIQGQKDIPLSIVGEKGAFELGAALKEKGISFDYYLSSPLKRAVETAQIIRFQLNQTDKSIKTMDEFKERSFGAFEGTHFDNISEIYDNPSLQNADGFEKNESLLRRVDLGYKNLIENYKNSKLVLVTHSNILKSILININPMLYNYKTPIPNLAVVQIKIDDLGNSKVIDLNLLKNNKLDTTA